MRLLMCSSALLIGAYWWSLLVEPFSWNGCNLPVLWPSGAVIFRCCDHLVISALL